MNTNFRESTPLVEQIVTMISRDIEKGAYKTNQRLLSINTSSKKYGVARDTMEKAYNRLKIAGYIKSIKGRGHFTTDLKKSTVKVLLLFDTFNHSQEKIHASIAHHLKKNAKVSVQIYNYCLSQLENIIDQSVGNYHFYVVMPHFDSRVNEIKYSKVLRKIPSNQLILLDNILPSVNPIYSVFQDYQQDIYNVLNDNTALKKYNKIVLVFPISSNSPRSLKDGLLQFVYDKKTDLEIITSLKHRSISNGEVYIVLEETDLILLLKTIKEDELTLGEEIGVISYQDKPFNELLNITAIEADFDKMGKTTAQMIMSNKPSRVKNPFKIILRNSL